jgi:hypothetical protein
MAVRHSSHAALPACFNGVNDMIRNHFFLAAAMLMAGSAANAQPGPGGMQRPNPDTNGDGAVSRAEAEAAATAMFARMDRNNDGRLTAEDRGGMGGGMGGGGGEGRGGRMMEMLDSNGDGAVTREEFTAAMLQRHSRMDTNRDGSVSAAEREAAQGARGGRGERRGMRRRPQ